jgi:hypothetical protein
MTQPPHVTLSLNRIGGLTRVAAFSTESESDHH